MKTRAEIKAQAMRGFTSRYWPVVGISVLGLLLTVVMGYIPMAGWLLVLFVGTIIMVGLNGFFLAVYRGNELKVDSLFAPFNRYGRVLGGSLWMALWLFLWSLIFVIPVIVIMVTSVVNAFVSAGPAALNDFYYNMGSGMMGGVFNNNNFYYNMGPGMMSGTPFFSNWVGFWSSFAQVWNPLWLLLLLLLIPVIIKQFSYFCTQYILADSPNVTAIDALTLSKKMMVGYKWKLFVLGLTFIGWFILSGLTFGILWIFFVGPYFNAAIAGFYDEVKEHAIQTGIPGTELL